VLESARMFATLDRKLRRLQPPSRLKTLLSDTVGLIRNLPRTRYELPRHLSKRSSKAKFDDANGNLDAYDCRPV